MSRIVVSLLAGGALLTMAHAASAQAGKGGASGGQSNASQTGQDQAAPSPPATAPNATEPAAPGTTTAATPATAAPVLTPDSFGDNFFKRFFNYQAAEWGKASSPISDPNAPPGRRAEFPPQPETSPPMPFTEWPYGGTTSLGVNRPSSVDSPLMVALSPSSVGKALNDAHIQVYGWVDAGANLSSNYKSGGNAPGAYDYRPNTAQLDQAVLYIERTPDTVQKDHIDWGFRLSAIYGVDYRYTTSYGLFSYQLLKKNRIYGYDAPMEYVELYVPQLAQGLLVRAGRFISLPDIEAQLAPNNYMYSHSLTYTFDNYTNTGVQATLAATKNLFLQFGVSVGSDTTLWNAGEHINNPFPNPLYPGSTYLKDPGAKASYTGCVRYETNSANDDIYLCADAINNGEYGYNNLQWYGLTYYHRFNDKWHLSLETYNLHQKDVPNLNNPIAVNAIAMGGTPFSPQNVPFNAPNAARCSDSATLKCTATAQSGLAYLNYQFTPLDNLSIRGEYYDDMQGQRTGTQTRYVEFAVGVQHWLSPQIELRPEIAYYNSLDAKAFNGNSNLGISPNKNYSYVASGDIIIHF